MVARLKLKGIDGRAPPGVNKADGSAPVGGEKGPFSYGGKQASRAHE